jgi:ERCC4-related helicase
MGEVLSILFINYVVPILGSLLMVLATYAIKKLADKLNVKIEKEQFELIQETAKEFIMGAEEKGATQLKLLGDRIDANHPKLDKFADVVGALMKKFPKLTEDEAGRIVDAMVSKIPGVGTITLKG